MAAVKKTVRKRKGNVKTLKELAHQSTFNNTPSYSESQDGNALSWSSAGSMAEVREKSTPFCCTERC